MWAKFWGKGVFLSLCCSDDPFTGFGTGNSFLGLATVFFFLFLYPLYYALCILGGVVFALDTLVILLGLLELFGGAFFVYSRWEESSKVHRSSPDGKRLKYELSDTQA